MRIAKYVTAAVLAHAVVVAVHSLAHVESRVYLSLAGNVFVVAVVIVAPIAAMVLVWMRVWRPGAVLLLVSMAAALLFGVYNHFIVVSSDHVLHAPQGKWQLSFQVSAVLLALTEGFGVWVGVRALRGTPCK